ncbi:F-box domain [Arabidopsis suecica]|uniref:F-box domain n=1 Tax=Arabidopsis suecica TaxID=45249 RepID=A0A8T2FLD2_ARASU|nr:F-box domain [Arabidopsis suecica]
MKLARQIEAMTISHLPTELLEEILSRLPLKSTRAVRSTCKKWDSLFKNRSFISKAAAAREGESQMVVLMDHNLHLVSFFFGSDSSVDTTIQIQNKSRYLKFFTVRVRYWIRQQETQPQDLESDLWTTLDVTTPHWLINCGNRGVTLKGNTYWCAKKRNSDLFLNADHIICFDFTSERFGPLLLLPFSDLDGVVTLACVREEKLAALVCHEDVVEVWITIKIEANEVLWSKFLTVNVDLGDEIPSSLTYGSFFIDEEKKVAMIFDKTLDRGDTVHIMGEAGYGGQVDLGEPVNKRRCPLVCSYVPSLVQIKKPAGFQRKQQSKLEKRQYVRNISKLRALKTQSSWTLSMSLECHQQSLVE